LEFLEIMERQESIMQVFLSKNQCLLLLSSLLKRSLFYYYLQSCEFNDLWTNDSSHFLFWRKISTTCETTKTCQM